MENLKHIDRSRFEFVQMDESIHDTKFETKAIGYFGDALRRFSRNKSSVVAFFILLMIILLAIFVPITSQYKDLKVNPRLEYLSPRIPIVEKLGILNGYKSISVRTTAIVSQEDPNYDSVKVATRVQYDTRFIRKQSDPYVVKSTGGDEYEYVDIEYDIYAYLAEPYVLKNVSPDQLIELMKLPGAILDMEKITGSSVDSNNYNVLVDPAIVDGFDTNEYHIFGTDALGRDLWTMVWAGSRTSLIIGLFVAVVTISFGIVWGSISGYYGGWVDLIMERFTEILGGIPWLVVMTLMKLYFGGSVVTVAVSLVLTSWIGTASSVRSQFYRYKGREYVLASRTLGARDRRLIFKHILPNSLGPIVTSSVLIIPSAIFFESNVSYLGIGVTTETSIGSLLSSGQALVTVYPHLTIAPAIIISLLMIAFNLFGNGLRDALNPTLRGVE